MRGCHKFLIELLQWRSRRKHIWKHTQKIIPHNYILYYGEPTYVRIVPVYLGVPLIFTNFQQCSWLRPTSWSKICEYQGNPWKNYKKLQKPSCPELAFGTQFYFWWLVSGCFWLFVRKNLGGFDGDLRMVLCHPMNAGSVVGIQ